MHIRNFLTLGSGEAVSRIVAFGAHIYLARILGAEAYGIIAFSAGVTLYLSKVADFAIEATGTAEIAKDPGAISRIGSAILGVRLTSTIGLILTSATVIQFTTSGLDRTVLTLYLLTLIPVAVSTKWIHMGLQRMSPIGIWRVVGESVFLSLVFTFVRTAGDLWIVPLALFAGDMVTASALYVKLRFSGHSLGVRLAPRIALPVYRAATPLLGQLILGLLLYNMDVLLLKFILDAEAVGYYAAAYTLISFLGNIGVVYGMSVLPSFSQLRENPDGERRLYERTIAEVLAVTLPIAVGGAFVARGIVILAFGDGYSVSVAVLQTLIWMIPMNVLRNIPWAVLVARGKSDSLFRATAAAVVANTALNIVLINVYGVVGAAIATLVAEPIVVGLMIRSASRYGLHLPSFRRLWRPMVACVAMASVLLLLGDVFVILQLAFGAVVYLVVLCLSGALVLEGRLPVLRV